MEEASVTFATAKGLLGATARQAGQLQRRIVSNAVTAQHILNVTPAQAEVVEKVVVKIGQAVRSKTIAQRNAKGSEPDSKTSKTRGRRPARPFSGQVEVKVEDPISRAHGYVLSAGTRKLSSSHRREQATMGWSWKLDRNARSARITTAKMPERILISPTNVSNDSHQPF